MQIYYRGKEALELWLKSKLQCITAAARYRDDGFRDFRFGSLDSGFWIPHSTFCFLDSGFRIYQQNHVTLI